MLPNPPCRRRRWGGGPPEGWWRGNSESVEPLHQPSAGPPPHALRAQGGLGGSPRISPVHIDQRRHLLPHRDLLDLADEDRVRPEAVVVDAAAEQARLGVDQARRAFAIDRPAFREAQ